jgi:hypothetical protein
MLLFSAPVLYPAVLYGTSVQVCVLFPCTPSAFFKNAKMHEWGQARYTGGA